MHVENNISNKRISNNAQQSVLSGNASSISYYPYSNLFYPYIADNANVNEDISLTITRTKKKTTETTFPNEKWDEVAAGFMPYNDYFWGFKETINPLSKSYGISNAFCFNGQTIRVHIEPKGSISGYFGNRWAYAKTNIVVTGTDLISGTQTVTKEFSDMEADVSSEERYFNITMPSQNIVAQNNYSIGGMYVVSLNVSYTLYEDVNFERPISVPSNITQQHNLQILLFSCSKEASNVTSPLVIFNEIVNGTETFDQLFDKSKFSEYNGVSSVELNSDKKRAIIADQIAVLFMSQHPVATSENYPCKILGYGIEEAIAPRYVIEKAYNYAKRHPDIIPLINSRMYGMLLNYKTFAFSSEIDQYFSEFDQSQQFIRDPSRIIAIKEDGRVDSDFGIEGLLFNPFNVETVNADIPLSVDREAIFGISLKTKNVEIKSINISDPDAAVLSSIVTLTPFDNSILTCPSLDFEDVLQEYPYATKMYIRAENTTLFPNAPYYDEFILTASGEVLASSSGTVIYTLLNDEDVVIKLYNGSPCYFVIEGTKNGNTWRYKSNGYNLSGTYFLQTYSSVSGTPNPYPTEITINLLSTGELNQELYQYKEFSNNKVQISFEPILGENLINRIRYSIWARESLAWMEYVDETGYSRGHIFDLTPFGGVGTKLLDGEVIPCGIINVKIDIEDVYGFVNSFYQDYFIPSNQSYPSILSVYGSQSIDGTGSIDVYYNYRGTSEINNTKIQLEYSLDNSSWVVANNGLSGDIGIAINPGFRRIKWYPWMELGSSVHNVYVKVTLVDVDDAENASRWQDSSIAIQVDIRKPTADIRILSQDELQTVYESSSSTESSESSSFSTSSSESSSSSFNYPINNLILFIGDGMGIAHQNAASMYKTGSSGQLLWQTSEFTSRTLMTNSLSGTTDSAAAGTAMATGVKVLNGVVSTVSNVDATPLRTIAEYAHENGKSTGLVTTENITGATPAVFHAHRTSRTLTAGIASDYYAYKPDVIFGKGGSGISVSGAEAVGYVVAETKGEMLSLTSSDGIVSGQFSPSLTDTFVRDGYPATTPRLTSLTEKAIELLSENENGFFLMAEGALIDHASDTPGQDINYVIDEVLDFEMAVQAAYDWASQRNDTMIIVTSDHETGGLTIVTNNGQGVAPTVTWSTGGHTSTNVAVYAWGPQSDDLSSFVASPGPNMHHTDVFRFMMEKLFPLESTSSSSSSP